MLLSLSLLLLYQLFGMVSGSTSRWTRRRSSPKVATVTAAAAAMAGGGGGGAGGETAAKRGGGEGGGKVAPGNSFNFNVGNGVSNASSSHFTSLLLRPQSAGDCDTSNECVGLEVFRRQQQGGGDNDSDRPYSSGTSAAYTAGACICLEPHSSTLS